MPINTQHVKTLLNANEIGTFSSFAWPLCLLLNMNKIEKKRQLPAMPDNPIISTTFYSLLSINLKVNFDSKKSRAKTWAFVYC